MTEVNVNIEKDKIVTFHFRLTDVSNSEVLEDTAKEGEPLAYLHGHGQMLPKLEEALNGHSAGDKFTVELAPEDAFGEIQELDPVRVPRKHILTKGKLAAGQVIELNTKEGVREAVVVKVGLKSVDLDPNHPHAGKTVSFDIEITEVRDASEEELSHGHAHGPGGHHH